MKNTWLPILISIQFALLFLNSNAQTQDTAWKHYEFKTLNLGIDLPPDTYFYSNDSTGLSGYNNSAVFSLVHLNEEIVGFEAMGSALYYYLGIDEKAFPITDDPNYQHGTTESGYLMVGTKVNIEDTGEEAFCFILSDKNNNKLNFILMGTFGGPQSSGYLPVLRFIKSATPIQK